MSNHQERLIRWLCFGSGVIIGAVGGILSDRADSPFWMAFAWILCGLVWAWALTLDI